MADDKINERTNRQAGKNPTVRIQIKERAQEHETVAQTHTLTNIRNKRGGILYAGELMRKNGNMCVSK